MRVAQILPVGAVLALLVGVQTALAEGWSMATPFQSGNKEHQTKKPVGTTPQTWQPMEKLGQGVRKFNAGTKKFFTGVGEAVTGKKTTTIKKTSSSIGSGVKEPHVRRPTPPAKPPKQSWFSSWSHREEPKPPESLDDWMKLKRLDP